MLTPNGHGTMGNKTSKNSRSWFWYVFIAILLCLVPASLYLFRIIDGKAFWMSLGTVPIIVANIYFLPNEHTPKGFKVGLAVGSLAFLAGLWAFFLLVINKSNGIKPFADNEFGIILIDWEGNSSNSLIDNSVLKDELNSLKLDNSSAISSIRALQLSVSELEKATLEIKSLVRDKMQALNASLGILTTSHSQDSVIAQIFLADKLMRPELGWHRSVLEVVMPLAEFPDKVVANVRTLTKLADPLALEKYSITSQSPETPAEKTLLSNQTYVHGNKILEKLNESASDPKQQQAVISRADTAFQQAVTIDSLNDKAYSMLAWISQNYKRDYESAIRFYTQTVKIHPESYEYNWNLARSLYARGKRAQAIKVLEDYLKNYGEQIEDLSKRSEMDVLLNMYKSGR
jgi:tetratricopeptide (TPR) repeat protein